VLDGSGPSPLGIAAADMTDDVWDYIFLEKPYKAGMPVPEDKLQVLRNEFK
jgi:leucyl-tRNA synthetase